MARIKHPETPDGRYFVAKEKLWRKTDPRLDDATRRARVKALMQARRAVKHAKQAEDDDALREARQAVDTAKIALGERGPVWWDDDAPDETGKHPRNSSYAEWWQQLETGK
ncbi:hypothetical protein IEI94_17410 [Halomonas sp. ML-15]|uniref:hypothetical protein n=1 Tax=Halomonas sp. ML-15 TaxID=2773305 RepID=UPI00174649EC|nr:hypothetical protein [Halomonas sp. ML-15]MBD3897637.1 hypothetical protein [Halomonas sp. ML-15]